MHLVYIDQGKIMLDAGLSWGGEAVCRRWGVVLGTGSRAEGVGSGVGRSEAISGGDGTERGWSVGGTD